MATYKYANMLGLVDKRYTSKEEWQKPEIKPKWQQFLIDDVVASWHHSNPFEELVERVIKERKKEMFGINFTRGKNWLIDDNGSKIPVDVTTINHERNGAVFHCRFDNHRIVDRSGIPINACYGITSNRTINPKCLGEKLIEKVIFHDPATIVYWTDGTKTVVKTQNSEKYDPEKGLAMAITKKTLGNMGNYYDTFAKWLKESEEAKG